MLAKFACSTQQKSDSGLESLVVHMREGKASKNREQTALRGSVRKASKGGLDWLSELPNRCAPRRGETSRSRRQDSHQCTKKLQCATGKWNTPRSRERLTMNRAGPQACPRVKSPKPSAAQPGSRSTARLHTVIIVNKQDI
ncbi:hypothetical protein NDU88_009251 [Pleurodeles waltl]|uniref:Uncharacterized protein n=1 Tax=Pleurodeles waltl TaxID=8319 RepID=A0AAV7PUH8_PLEWA|nr:hypothetical protein NDU88_009251 [Pleurodeles waltl]